MPIINEKYLLASILSICVFLAGAIKPELKTLKRVDDPIVIVCKELGALIHTPIDRLGLMARHGENWVPIPFQIDQKKPDGNYIFTGGPKGVKIPDPKLDALDELVFMVKDTGDRAVEAKLPNGAETGAEIEITDLKNGALGWVYIFRFSSKAPRSMEDYIKLEIDPVKKRRKVTSYEYVMGGPIDRIYPDFIARVLPNGGVGLDVLDRLKMRGAIVIPGGVSFPLIMDEMTKARDIGWIDGPVRILYLVDGYLELAGFIKIRGSGYSCISYYPNHMIWPMLIEVPKESVKLMKKISLRGFMDFNKNVYGSHSFNAANPLNKNVILDGHMSEAEKRLDTQTQVNWIAGFGPQGAVVNRLFFVPKTVDNMIKKVTYYLDDETAIDSPEDNPGVSGVGYYLTDLEKTLAEGPAHIYQYYYFKSDLAPKDINQILDILDNPVQVKVKPYPPAN